MSTYKTLHRILYITLIAFVISLINEFAIPTVKGSQNSLTLFTYNIYGYRSISKKRVDALISVIDEADADIIALQEVSSWFLRRLRKEGLLKEYNSAFIQKQATPKGKLVILSKFPVTKVAHYTIPSRGGHSMLIAHIQFRDSVIPVANIHLESPLLAISLRVKQLDALFRKLNSKDHSNNAIVLGDFNFGDNATLEPLHIPVEFTDMWPALRLDEPGYTYNLQKNSLAKRNAYRGEQSRRLDRIIVNSGFWEPVNIRIIGKNPVPLRRNSICPSDHFGLLGIIEARN